MYASFFGFSELPFNITPDPRFLYLNGCYQEALAALTYGIDARKGFISVIGEAGTGKTTLLRRLLDTVAPSTRTVLLLNPTVGFDEILEHILAELGIPSDGGRKLALLQRLNEFLLEHTRAGGNVALLIDEAQDLAIDVLEELRLLSNLETAREKILQIVLAGQPELEEKLSDPRLRQLRQRVTLPIRIRTLGPEDVAAYVRTRVERVGGTDPHLFSAAALARIAAVSQGIPRLINVVCDAALLNAFVTEKRQVTPEVVDEVWRDFAPHLPPRPAEAAPAALAPAEPAPAPAAEVVAPAALESPARVEPAPEPPAVTAPAAPAAETPAPPARTFSVPAMIGAVLLLAGVLGGLMLQRASLDAAPAVVAARPAAPPTPIAPFVAPVGNGPVSSGEATAVIDAFRAAFDARDADALRALFAADAVENGRGDRERIASTYRTQFGSLDEVRYTLAHLAVEPRGERADVRSPFVIDYRAPSGASGEIRGEAEWHLERREGRPLIVALDYRLEPESDTRAAR